MRLHSGLRLQLSALASRLPQHLITTIITITADHSTGLDFGMVARSIAAGMTTAMSDGDTPTITVIDTTRTGPNIDTILTAGTPSGSSTITVAVPGHSRTVQHMTVEPHCACHPIGLTHRTADPGMEPSDQARRRLGPMGAPLELRSAGTVLGGTVVVVVGAGREQNRTTRATSLIH